MTIQLTTDQVWQEIEQNLFAVLGMVTPTGEARTVGIVYVVDDHKLYIGTQKAAWKAKHIAAQPTHFAHYSDCQGHSFLAVDQNPGGDDHLFGGSEGI